MNALKPIGHRCLIATAAWIFTPLFLAAEEPAPAAATESEAAAQAARSIKQYQLDPDRANTSNVKQALDQLDAEIVRLEERAADAPDQTRRQAAEARLDALKDRRNELRREFSQSRFDELKADVRQEWNDFKGWVRRNTDKPVEQPRSQKSPSAAQTRDTGDYVRTPEAGGAPVAVNRDALQAGTEESPTAAKHQQQAMARMDQELAALERQKTALAGRARERLAVRIQRLQERREQLELNFTDDRYNSLVKDIRSEIERTRSAAE